MLDIREAQERILSGIEPLPGEELSLKDALGRYLSEDVLAREDAPPFSNSAMDGYAVRAADLSGASAETPVRLTVAGESKAGSGPGLTLTPGSAIRIFTGAPVPIDADAVVMQEDTDREGDAVAVRLAVPVGHHIRVQGEDTTSGQVLLRRGHRVGAGAVGLLASQGCAHVAVHRRPRVAIVATGDELRDIEAPPSPGTIVDSNRYALAAQITEAGCEPWPLPRVGDDLRATAARIEEALTADVVLTTGGVSVGEHDHVRAASEQAGIEPDFWKVRIKPGKPLTFGRRGSVPVIGLPGNPASAMVTFHVFVLPALRRMLGDPLPHHRPFPVVLAKTHRRKPGRPELARARIEVGMDGASAMLLTRQGSGALPSVAEADALVLLPADRAELPAGEVLMAIPFGHAAGAGQSPFEK
jgi:molybdopterin molybdotransferase